MKFWLTLLAVGFATSLAARAQDAPSTVITCQGRMETISTDNDTTITFRDHVVATGNAIVLDCDFLKVIVLRQGDPTATLGQYKNFKSLIATGHVQITQGDRVATCGRAEVFPNEDRIILSEGPVLRFLSDKTVVDGYRMILNRGQRDAIIEPIPGQGVHAVLPPIKDLGFGQGGKPATTPSAPAK